MAKTASFFDLAMMTADDATETHGGRSGAKDGQYPSAPWLIDYLMSTVEPVIWYRQLIDDKWQWMQTPDKEALKENPYSLNPYTASTLARRAEMGGDVPTGSVLTLQAPARKAA